VVHSPNPFSQRQATGEGGVTVHTGAKGDLIEGLDGEGAHWSGLAIVRGSVVEMKTTAAWIAGHRR
jgi:hypothetical protein